jgi:hypothetical protein
MTDQDLIAAFLASKGATKIAPGARVHSERDMFLAVRGDLTRTDTAEQLAEHRSERLMESAMEARFLGHRVIGVNERGDIVTE